MIMENLDDDLHIPKIESSLLEAVGAFIFSWGIVERELDTAFPVLFHTDPTLASCVYANLGTRAKIDMLLSAIDMMSSKLGKGLTESAQSTLGLISVLSDKARNTLAHGQPLFLGETAKDARWEIARQAARNSHRIVVHPRNPRYWDTQSKIALRLAQRWRTCTAKIYRKIGHLTLAELEAICKTQIRVSQPSLSRPRKNLPPRKHLFAGRQASVAKWPRS
jgi:hypothetical protein